MRMLQLKVPPVAVTLLFVGLIWLVARSLPGPTCTGAACTVLAGGLAGLGGAIALAGVWQFRRARTTVHPLRPETASTLVTTGVYRFTRNPMYLGLLLALFGWAILLGQPAALLLAAGYVPVMNRLQIGPEENALRTRFGAAFNAYQSRVRRWL